MKEISIYLMTLTLIEIWVMQFNQVFDGGKIYYKFRWAKYMDFKPINCRLCLSFWVGLILAICFGDVLYISLPLIHMIRE